MNFSFPKKKHKIQIIRKKTWDFKNKKLRNKKIRK